MSISKICRLAAVGFASVVALAGLASQGLSVGGATSAVDQDFIVLNQVATTTVEKSGQAETLSDWEFTVRTRPPKCRFVN